MASKIKIKGSLYDLKPALAKLKSFLEEAEKIDSDGIITKSNNLTFKIRK